VKPDVAQSHCGRISWDEKATSSVYLWRC